MGRVRTKTVKRSAKVVIERYYPKLTLDFEVNKKICDEVAIIASKRLRNKVWRIRHQRIDGRMENKDQAIGKMEGTKDEWLTIFDLTDCRICHALV